MKTLERTAELWANQIINGRWDNGDGLQNMFGSMLRSQAGKPTPEQIETFKKVLIEESLKQLELRKCVNLGVDYNPDKELRVACEKAGISTDLLPVKSITMTTAEKVEYKFGYGQPLVTE